MVQAIHERQKPVIPDEENQGDPRYHLPPKHSIITPERAAMADMRCHSLDGQIREAHAQVNSIMNYLHEKRILTKQHAHDGQTYEVWQICFTSEFQVKENPIYSPEAYLAKSVQADGLDIATFERVLRGLTREQKRNIDHSLEPGATEHRRWLALRYSQHYRKAYDALSEIMKVLRDEHAEYIENLCL